MNNPLECIATGNAIITMTCTDWLHPRLVWGLRRLALFLLWRNNIFLFSYGKIKIVRLTFASIFIYFIACHSLHFNK
ncbi:hypothetical protein PHDIMM138B_04940 [Phytobacter diazotrophicus]